MELWVTGDRSALSLEANANYFRENLFHRASLCWLGRKDQIYPPRLSHLASFTFLSLLLPGFCFFCFPPRPIVLVLFQWLRHSWSQEQAGSSFGVLGWGGLSFPAPAALLCPVLGGSQQVLPVPSPTNSAGPGILNSSACTLQVQGPLMGKITSVPSEALDVGKGTGGNCFLTSLAWDTPELGCCEQEFFLCVP